MALTDLKIKASRPASKPHHLTDGHGFFLVVQPNGSMLWRWKYRFEGKFRLMALGSYPEVSLANARTAHAEAPVKLLKGIDPMTERKAEKTLAQSKPHEVRRCLCARLQRPAKELPDPRGVWHRLLGRNVGWQQFERRVLRRGPAARKSIGEHRRCRRLRIDEPESHQPCGGLGPGRYEDLHRLHQA
jgi:hypothetical protein